MSAPREDEDRPETAAPETTAPGTTAPEETTPEATAEAAPDADPGGPATDGPAGDEQPADGADAGAAVEPTTPVTTAEDVARDAAGLDPEGAVDAPRAEDDSSPEDTSSPGDAGPVTEAAVPSDDAVAVGSTADEVVSDPVADADPGATPAGTSPGDTPAGTSGVATTPSAADEPAADTEPATGAGAAPSPRPAPRPGPGRPGPRPSGPRPGAAGPTSSTGASSPSSPSASSRGPRPAGRPGGRRRDESAGAPAVTAEHAPADTAEWGRVDDEGVVHVRTADGERVVGSYPDVAADEALAYFGRRFADLVAQVDLVEQRLDVADAPVGELRSALAKVSRALQDATAVGDLAGLGERVDALGARVTEREREANIAREQARGVVRAQRVELVEEAEALAEADPAQVQWKASGERLRALFDLWREQQRAAGTARLPKGEEDDLWRRLKHARNRFERHRRHHFAELDARHGEAKAVKEGLIAEAEALSGSTEWGPTSTAYRQLMDRWKAAPRAARKEDDALWARFRAAQDVFFSARDAKDAEQLEGEKENLAVKEALLVEAEAILPVRDVRAATAALRDVQERWDAAGRVPRADLGRIEKRMRAVEQAVRDADSERWRRTNPEARARAEGALGQLQDSIAGLEAELEQAEGAGDERAVRRAREALDARRAWLQQVERAAADFSG
ncbi:DUF349 domain-containing protein [Pseudokineococcus sp. 5B2Z-1]|uniref:DUF349 domain-containing protein n=1 Tax=Pseudokineococcus sp. 5B2Z-1 TaxID=3132744 RepID=UPI00309670D4